MSALSLSGRASRATTADAMHDATVTRSLVSSSSYWAGGRHTEGRQPERNNTLGGACTNGRVRGGTQTSQDALPSGLQLRLD